MAAVVIVAGSAVLLLVGTDGTMLVLLAVVALAAAALTTVLVGTAWRNWGWPLDGAGLFITYGVLGRHHQVFHLDRVQHVAVTSSPYQRATDSRRSGSPSPTVTAPSRSSTTRPPSSWRPSQVATMMAAL